MPFRDPIVAGVTLVRDAIQSRNYVAGVSGWTINSDGTAEFSSIVVRADLQSANYVAGVSGYKLSYLTGTLEANAATLHGSLEVGTAGGQRVEVSASSGIPRVELWPHDGETQPGFLAGLTTAQSGSGAPATEIDSPNLGPGVTLVQLVSPPASGTDPGTVFITGSNGTPTGTPATVVNLDAAVTLFSQNVHDVSLSSINHAFQIGPTAGLNLAMDNNEIMARNAGTASSLSLNQDGGNVLVGAGGLGNALISGSTTGLHMTLNNNQLWALNNTAASTLFLNFSSASPVQVGDGTAAGADLICVAMRPVQSLDAGPVAITATAFLASTPNITMPYPSSGSVLIHISARCNQAAAGQRGLMAAQIRDTNAAGAIRFAWNDNSAVEFPDTTPQSYGRTLLVTGLPTSGTMYIETGLRSTSAANSASFTNMRLVVEQTP